MRNIRKDELETHRATWAKVAKENGWYTEPFFIQVWVSKNGTIVDSVSYKGMTKDIICDNRKDALLGDNEYTIEYNAIPFISQLDIVRKSAIIYITKVLMMRGANYELIDPAMYEDDNEIDDSVFNLPRAIALQKYGAADEYPIVLININDKGELSFVGIDVLSEMNGDDETFTTDSLTTETLCAIADLVASLEK